MLNFDRKPNQIWLLFAIESPRHTGGFTVANNRINWTAIYRRDSQISTPYYKYFPYYQQNIPQNIDYSLGKTKKVVWFVSNCNTDNHRLQYVRQLQQYIEVDIYGQ